MEPIIDVHTVKPVVSVDALDIGALAPGRHRLGVHLVDDAASRPVLTPTLVIKGASPGPVVGLIAAVHGNELNGIATIHNLFATITPDALSGAVVGVTIANVPGYLRHQRVYTDGADLNRIMPGKPHGSESQIYAHRLLERVLSRFDYLIDLHTASFGRVNSLYVRANLADPVTARLARAIGPQIIVHNAGGDGTTRAAMAALGIPSITVEIGDPQVIDDRYIQASRIGIRDALEQLGLVAEDAERAPSGAIECARSEWLYTDAGGLLEVHPAVAARVAKGEVVASLFDPWGDRLRTYRSPEDGVVIGKSTNPVCRSGSRILHLGVEGPIGGQ
jgi:predicted deacylase